jgi:hypothetical protein
MTSRTRDTARTATDAGIDRAIDAVARQTTEGSPAGDLRRRVLARIEAGQAPRANWRAAWVLSPVAAAAVIVMAIFVARGFQPRTVRLKPDATSPTVRLEPDATSPTVRLKPDATSPTVRLRPDTTSRTVRLKPDATNRAVAIAALAAPSLDLAPLTVDALAPDSILLERLDTTLPITILPITVAPLDITDVQRR